MGFIEEGAGAAYAATLDRVRQRLDYGYENQRPELDEKQRKEWDDGRGDGKTDEPYRQCLAYHGFRWYPMLSLPVLPGTTLRTEGEWRNHKTNPNLATLGFTPSDLTTGFQQGPESLDRFLREHKLAAKVRKGKAPKEALRRARDRK